METDTFKNSRGTMLRKIPVTSDKSESEKITEEGIDKIKILELSTVIDKWEQEVLFGDNGFYSLKGRNVENKTNDYINELKEFINSKIIEMVFSNVSSKETAKKIKDEKISAVKKQMEIYSNEQLNEWETSTYEEALATTIKRAVLYKSNLEVVERALKNGLTVLDVIAEKEEWNKKLFGYKKNQFISDFYIALINEFIKEKDISAYQYFNRFKNFIQGDEKEKIEKQVNIMRVNIIANNWAKEIFSYKLDEKDFEKQLNDIKDDEIKTAAKQFYIELKKSEKRQKFLNDKQKNADNWKEVTDAAAKDIDTADLFIDYSLDKNSIKSKKEYIKQIREFSGVRTDVKEFLVLFDSFINDFQTFKDRDISNYRGYLCNEDYLLYEKLQQYSLDEYTQTAFDFKSVLPKKEQIKDDEKYYFIKIYFISINEYKMKKKEIADLESRKKIVEAIVKERK